MKAVLRLFGGQKEEAAMTTLPPPALVQTHYTELVERHEISAQLVGAPDELHRAAIWSEAQAAAQAWCDEQGVGANIDVFEGPDHTYGVRFEVVVAKAVACPADTPEQWRWSNRWRDWLRRFTALRRAEDTAHPVSPGAKIIQLHRD